jgi:hypothetical protein
MAGIDGRYAIQLARKLKAMHDEKRRTDFTVIVEGEHFGVHSSVLMCGSAYFATLLESMVGCESSVVELPEMRAPIFKQIVESTYTGLLDGIDGDNVMQLLEGSKRLQVAHAEAHCCAWLCTRIDVSNALTVWESACKLDVPSVQKRALEFSRLNLVQVLNHESFLELSSDHLVELLFDRDTGCFFSSHEETVYASVMRWVRRDENARKAEVGKVLGAVRLWLLPEQCHALAPNEALFRDKDVRDLWRGRGLVQLIGLVRSSVKGCAAGRVHSKAFCKFVIDNTGADSDSVLRPISLKKTTMAREIVAEGGAHMLVELLNDGRQDVRQSQSVAPLAAEALECLAQADPSGTVAVQVGKAGGIAALMALLPTDNDAVMPWNCSWKQHRLGACSALETKAVKALRDLTNASKTTTNRQTVGSNFGLERLFMLLREGCSDSIFYCLQLLDNLTLFHSRIAGAGGVVLLIGFLQHKDRRLVAEALQVLHSLASYSDATCELIASEGGARHLVAILRAAPSRDSPRIQGLAAGVLKLLCLTQRGPCCRVQSGSSTARRAEIVALGGIPLLCELLPGHVRAGAVVQALDALASHESETAADRAPIAAEGPIKALVALMRGECSWARAACCNILCSLAIDSAANRARIADLGAIPPLVKLVQMCATSLAKPGAKEAQSNAAEALRILALHCEVVQKQIANEANLVQLITFAHRGLLGAITDLPGSVTEVLEGAWLACNDGTGSDMAATGDVLQRSQHLQASCVRIAAQASTKHFLELLASVRLVSMTRPRKRDADTKSTIFGKKPSPKRANVTVVASADTADGKEGNRGICRCGGVAIDCCVVVGCRRPLCVSCTRRCVGCDVSLCMGCTASDQEVNLCAECASHCEQDSGDDGD